ncbi:MAG: ABC transporter substrate-binding protein [Defluviitaleaceae bacterium]|nr:ABC transporter substrate-binding protein [Defluviitaleaceae bacterium]
MKKTLITIVALLVLVLVFAACNPRTTDDDNDNGNNGIENGNGGGNDTAGGVSPMEAMNALMERFPQHINTGAAHVPGTTFMYGIGLPEPFVGMVGGAIFHDRGEDATVATLLGSSSSIVSMNEFFQMGQDGIATFEYDLEENSITFTMQHDVYWHDDTPLTMADLVFTYEVLASPDYTGIRRTREIEGIVGFLDFANGEADSIEGLVLSNNDRTLTIYMYELPMTVLYFSLWTSPMPRHIFEDIPVAQMASHPAVLSNPIGWGPFMIEHIVPGDAFHMVANPNYVFGAPQIENLIVERFNPTQAGELMEAGRFDIMAFPRDLYRYHQNASNITFLSAPSNEFYYISFRLGNWDDDNRVNVYNPDRLMAQLGADVRRAMAYALDEQTFTQIVFEGLRFPAPSIAPPNHMALIDQTVPGFRHDPARANQILDDAGLTERDADGFRLMPDGSPLTINWAMSIWPMDEERVAFYTQRWNEIGLRVVLWQGRLHDRNYLLDALDFDSYYGSGDEIHIAHDRFIVGANPNPDGMWGHTQWNPSRYTSPEYDAILERMTSVEAWDAAYLQQVFSDWQWYWYNNVPAIPLSWTINLTALNSRVTNWDTRAGVGFTGNIHNWSDIGLSAEQPNRN